MVQVGRIASFGYELIRKTSFAPPRNLAMAHAVPSQTFPAPEGLPEDHPLGGVLAQMLWLGATTEQEDLFLAKTLPLLREAVCSSFVGLLAPRGGVWRTVAQSGSATAPGTLAAQAADTGRAVHAQGWSCFPPLRAIQQPEVLAFQHGEDSSRLLGLEGETLAAAFFQALSALRQRVESQRRAQRLERILQITSRWGQHRNLPELFQDMAEAATELLECQRATIFVWDRQRRQLVGRPALGLENQELRVPDDQGVVGHVVRQDVPVRINPGEDQSLINRQVDQQTGFRTESVLCVPLRGSGGRVLGAFQVLNKLQGEFTLQDQQALEELAQHAAVALANVQSLQELLRANQVVAEQAAQEVEMIGRSPAIEALRETVLRVAGSELSVLVLGENGTGKEVVAQMLHYHSPRRQRPLVAVNCAALTPTLLESELFGHEKGAFTGADETRIGKFEHAHGGTLFLDEIGELSPEGQAKLLRAIERGEIVRVGGNVPIPVDVRVVAATNRDLTREVKEGKFRQDLFYRLNVVTVLLPPLRERGEDVLLLARHFLERFCAKIGRSVPELSPDAQQALLQHSWPGNVRELRNMMERLAYLFTGDVIRRGDLGLPADEEEACAATGVPLGLPLSEATRQFQIQYIEQTIQQCQGRMVDVARRLGLHRSNLYRKMRQLGMNEPKQPDANAS